jgi:hypothetical protein
MWAFLLENGFLDSADAKHNGNGTREGNGSGSANGCTKELL